MITICKTVLSGALPAVIREQTEGLASGGLRDVQDAVALVRAILLDDPAS